MLSKKSVLFILITVFLSWLLLAPNDHPLKLAPQNHALVKVWVSRIRDIFQSLSISPRPRDTHEDRLTTEENGDRKLAVKIFTKSELSKYKGGDGKKASVYLAILGQVYDVTKGRKHYGPGEAYSIFAGIDASRAFVTGDFTEKGLTDDIESLKASQFFELKSWKSFYDKEYPSIGYLSGPFYDSNGQPTEVLKKIDRQIEEYKKEIKKIEATKKQLPPCNQEWKPTGSRVWCSQKSGGITRDWAGVPRQHFKPGSTSPTCVCVWDPRNHQHHTLKEYKGCDSLATSCNIPSK